MGKVKDVMPIDQDVVAVEDMYASNMVEDQSIWRVESLE